MTPYDPDPLEVIEWHRGAQDRRRSLLSRLVALVKGWLGPKRATCWFCKRDVAWSDLIAGYDTWDEQRLACSDCDRRMKATGVRPGQ